ncbi:hypothetical protein TBLA_0E03800 [Henningerozyma blattae CBS 6284]|uniref:Major facilitator superfamily (MFS) profile domain-containing protein n=1 Tax=Henningerozyma blattae (strain ATCC 34711 / CBS 6284 / DSM 70876 / NBRC 10599 / NRRL Y-10934 / UCD 77-7) TaxID=1071380 RepID=I2H4Y2_HENB6|nr:hypothetical protein TBLA_0E03800 [Tetrapisispora blattae CBS 6284]CCH61434.1 hypothetical protein TBLA_0E03800 [Tetrapisispora blattae CBS 6284]
MVSKLLENNNNKLSKNSIMEDNWNSHSQISLSNNGLIPTDEESDMDSYNPITFDQDSVEIDKLDEPIDTTSLYKTKSGQHNEPTLDEPPYSRFGRKEKIFLVIQCAFTGLFSSIAGSIYYPVLSVMEKEFYITEEQVNVSVVVYFIFQALSPTLMGGLADSLGRRPVVLSSIVLYFCACIGLARCTNYSQLIGLRCLQAAGISPVIAVNSGIMGDVTTKAERGGYMGLVSGTQVLGTAFGALIGAGLSSRWSWRSIFWFLVIGSGICLIVSIIVLPETKRTVAGNGSITPKSYLNRAPILTLPSVRRKLHLDSPEYSTLEKKNKVNLLAPFSVMKDAEVCCLLLVAGLQYATWTTHQTALTTALAKDYHLHVAIIGVCFLPSGICTMISVVTTGRYLNWIYSKKLAAHKAWFEEQRKELLKQNNNNIRYVEDLMTNDPTYTFNIYKARLQPALATLVCSSAGFCAFGWCVDVHAPLAAVLCMSGFGSLFSNCILTMSTTLIVDLFPSKASTATGCLNLFRCSLSAIFIACLTKMVKHMTYGGVFTFLTSITGLSAFLLLIPISMGKQLTHKKQLENAKLLKMDHIEPLGNDEDSNISIQEQYDKHSLK